MRTAVLSTLLVSATLLVQAPALGARQTDPAGAGGALVIEGVTVVDVEADRLLQGRRVVVRDGRIASVEAAGGTAPTDEAVRVNGSGLFLIPGLVDHHVHLGPGMDDALERALRGGVTLVQSMAGDTRIDGAYQQRVLAGDLDGPEIAYAAVMAGPAFHEDPRFRGASLGWPAGGAPWMQAATAATDPVTAVARSSGSGAEVLKLYAMMEPSVVAGLTAEAHRQGMRVVAHGTVFPARPSALVAAGVDVLTHAPYLSWEGADTISAEDSWRRREGPYSSVAPDGPEITAVLEAMARRGTALEPTLWVFQRGSDVDSTLVRWADGVTRRASELGVTILAGTDGLIGEGPDALPNLHAELAALVTAGLTPAQALAAATVAPARVMGRGTTHGKVAPGFVADLVLVAADPLADVAATREIRYVVRRGRIVER